MLPVLLIIDVQAVEEQQRKERVWWGEVIYPRNPADIYQAP